MAAAWLRFPILLLEGRRLIEGSQDRMPISISAPGPYVLTETRTRGPSEASRTALEGHREARTRESGSRQFRIRQGIENHNIRL
jgi:hypothetical protein